MDKKWVINYIYIYNMLKIIKTILETRAHLKRSIKAVPLLPFISSVKSLHLIWNLNLDRLLVSVMFLSSLQCSPYQAVTSKIYRLKQQC